MKSLQSIIQKYNVKHSVKSSSGTLLSASRNIFLSSALVLGLSSCLPCYGNDSNCAEGEICVENACVLQEMKEDGKNSFGEDSGIFSQREYANEQGEAVISSPQGVFAFVVQDLYSGELLPTTEMDFIQGNGFSLLTLGKAGYIKQLEIVSPDAPGRASERRRTVGLIPSNAQHVTIFDYYFSSHQEEVLALNNYQLWAEDAYFFQGCVTKEELQQGRDYTMALFSFLSPFGNTDYFKMIAKVYGAVLEATDLGILDTLSYDRYKVYDPLNFTAPPLFEGVANEEIDDGCY